MALNAQETLASMILDAAATAPLGIVVSTNDPYKARATIYTTRQKLGNPLYAEIQIKVSPDNPEREIWLIRKDQMAAIALEQAYA